MVPIDGKVKIVVKKTGHREWFGLRDADQIRREMLAQISYLYAFLDLDFFQIRSSSLDAEDLVDNLPAEKY